MGLICVTVLACPELYQKKVCVSAQISDLSDLAHVNQCCLWEHRPDLDQSNACRSSLAWSAPPSPSNIPLLIRQHSFFGHVFCSYNVLSKKKMEIKCAFCRADQISSSRNLIQCFKPHRSVQHPLVEEREKKSYSHKALIDCYWYRTSVLTRVPKYPRKLNPFLSWSLVSEAFRYCFNC